MKSTEERVLAESVLPNSGIHKNDSLASKSARAFHQVATRQILAKSFGLVASLILARLLTPADFGVFSIVCFAIAVCGLISDGGLAAALLRQPEKPHLAEESSIFWCQLILALAQFLIVQLCAPFVLTFYKLHPNSILLMRFLSITPIFAVLRTLPTIRLEREMKFDVITRVEIWQSVFYNFAAVGAAVAHFGVWSFAFASVGSQVLGWWLLNLRAPFRPIWAIDFNSCKEKLKFGLRYQATNILSFFKDVTAPVYIGLMNGSAAAGYVNFANQTANYGTLITSPFNRMYLPIFSNAQLDAVHLRSSAERIIRWNVVVVAGFCTVLLPNCDRVIATVFGDKWNPAAQLLCLLLISNLATVLFIPLYSLANALNRADIPMKFASRSTITAWALTIALYPCCGIASVGFAQILSQGYGINLVSEIQHLVPGLKIWNCISRTFFAAVFVSIESFSLRPITGPFMGHSINCMAISAFQGIVFLAVANLLWKNELVADVRTLLEMVKQKS